MTVVDLTAAVHRVQAATAAVHRLHLLVAARDRYSIAGNDPMGVACADMMRGLLEELLETGGVELLKTIVLVAVEPALQDEPDTAGGHTALPAGVAEQLGMPEDATRQPRTTVAAIEQLEQVYRDSPGPRGLA